MIINGCVVSGSQSIKLTPCFVKRTHSSTHVPALRAYGASPKLKNLSVAHQEYGVFLQQGSMPLQHFGASKAFLDGKYSIVAPRMPSLGRKVRPRSSVVSGALKSLYSYPKMTSKPRWWWRTLACFPYLLPLHELWLHADSVYHLHRILEDWVFLVNPFLDTVGLMPGWLFMAVLYCVYFFVVKRKEWPHFLRFHIIMAMLLENGYAAMAIACRWLPGTAYRGSLARHFWLAVAFAQLYTLLESMRCAILGKYADVPFVSDAAYLHSDPNLLPS